MFPALVCFVSTASLTCVLSVSQPRNDMLPAMDVMKEYLGMIFAFPDMVDIHRGAASKVKDCSKMKEECRIDVSGRFPWLTKIMSFFVFGANVFN